MKESLIFIPFQDAYCFLNDGILTREYAALLQLKRYGAKSFTLVNKPRTILDARRFDIDEARFPQGTHESEARYILENALTINPASLLDPRQVLGKRKWWSSGYMRALPLIKKDLSQSLAYSNNPFSWKLLLELKQRGCTICFDAMDNMSTYPHFWKKEQEEAYFGYRTVLQFADFTSVNSLRTKQFFLDEFDKDVPLIKNGVFQNILRPHARTSQVEYVTELKSAYRTCAGFVGKIGMRIDHRLIKHIANEGRDCLFVFVGPKLNGQCRDFDDVVSECPNVIKLDAIPSAYLFEMLDVFDFLMIPYSVGKNENSGDPLKLYQYFLTGKPILCTSIKEVDSYAHLITVSDNCNVWADRLRQDAALHDYSSVVDDITWEHRFEPLAEFCKGLA